jgi:hypothetical protein
MTADIGHLRRTWLPALNLILAGGAAALGVIAIVSDDVGSTAPQPAPAAVAPADGSGIDDIDLRHDKIELSPTGGSGGPVDDCSNGPAHGPPVPC